MTFLTDTQKSVSYVNFAYLSKEFTAKIIEVSDIIFMFFKENPNVSIYIVSIVTFLDKKKITMQLILK